MTLGCTIGGAAVVAAQSPVAQPDIPAGYLPPAGMCRVWLRDVPPVQQPAPTDCRSALRGKPVGASVIYGPTAERKTPLSMSVWARQAERALREDDRSQSSRVGSDESRGDPCTRGASCDESGPPALPAMRSAVLWIEGQRPADLQRWFGAQTVSARFTMPSRGGSPDRVTWYDNDGRLVQVWIDRNGDGRADRVEMFSADGARIRVIGQ